MKLGPSYKMIEKSKLQLRAEAITEKLFALRKATGRTIPVLARTDIALARVGLDTSDITDRVKEEVKRRMRWPALIEDAERNALVKWLGARGVGRAVACHIANASGWATDSDDIEWLLAIGRRGKVPPGYAPEPWQIDVLNRRFLPQKVGVA